MASATVLVPSTTTTTSGSVLLGALATPPRYTVGKLIAGADVAIFQLHVSAVTGTNPTLDIQIQHSLDGGTSWDAFLHFAQATTTGRDIAQWFRDLAPSALTHTLTTSISAATVLNGPIGSDWQVVWAAPGGTNTPTFTFNLKARLFGRRT